jgi:hypothetical protein
MGAAAIVFSQIRGADFHDATTGRALVNLSAKAATGEDAHNPPLLFIWSFADAAAQVFKALACLTAQNG